MQILPLLVLAYLAYQAYESVVIRAILDFSDSHPDLDRVDAVFGLFHSALQSVGLVRDISKYTAKDLQLINDYRNENRQLIQTYATLAPQLVRDCFALKTCTARNISFSSEDGSRNIQALLIQPSTKTTHPRRLVVYFHGGGMVVGDAYNAPVGSGISAALDAIVMSVAYRKAPEHRYPEPVEDGFEALAWAFKNAKDLGADATTLMVAGESAGSLMSAAVSLLWKQRKRAEKIHQLFLIVPMLSPVISRSYTTYEDIHTLPARNAGFFWDMYATNIYECVIDPICSPGTATIDQLKGVAERALVIYAKADVLRDEAKEFIRKLDKAGVKVTEVASRGTHVGVVLFDDILENPTVVTALKNH